MTRTHDADVWLLDDDGAVRDSLQLLLEAEGYAVRVFVSGPALLRAVGTETPQCLILDINMPEMDGFQVMDALRARNVQVPVIVVTGRGNARVEAHAEKAGALCVLVKPVMDDALLGALQAALTRWPTQ